MAQSVCSRAIRLMLATSAALSVSVPVVAQTLPQGDGRAWWADVNFGVAASRAGTEDFVYAATRDMELLTLAAHYPAPPTGASFDFGVGRMITPLVGLGMSFTGTAHEDTAGLGASIPHPYFFNAYGTDGSVTNEKLMRAEGGANVQIVIKVVRRPNVAVRVFGGPTFFSYRADMVRDISYFQLATPLSRANVVTIDEYMPVEVEGRGIGFHVGADVSWFFAQYVGLGGFVRLNAGTVTIEEPMSERDQDLDVGGSQFGGGLRFRF